MEQKIHQEDEWISVKQAARMLGVSPQMVYEMLDSRFLEFRFLSPPDRIRRRKKVLKSSVEEYLREQRQPTM